MTISRQSQSSATFFTEKIEIEINRNLRGENLMFSLLHG